MPRPGGRGPVARVRVGRRQARPARPPQRRPCAGPDVGPSPARWNLWADPTVDAAESAWAALRPYARRQKEGPWSHA